MALLQGLAHYNQAYATAAEHYDDFMLDRQLSQPGIWHDRVARDAYPLYSGMSQKTNIYRGGLVHQAGLKPWSQMNTSQKPSAGDPGYDNCAIGDTQTYGYSVEPYEYVGFKTQWQSLPICVNDMKFVDYAKEQLKLVIQSGVDFGYSLQETFNREMFVLQAIKASRGFVMAEGALDFIDSAAYRFTYYPFDTLADVNGDLVPYLTFPSALELSALNFDLLDYVHYDLSIRAGKIGAIGMDSGRPTFGLMIDPIDFEKYVKSDANRRADWNYAYPVELIKGYDMGLRVYRGYALMPDLFQMRFRVKDIQTIGSTSMVRATRVLPQRGGPQVEFGRIPEPNPDYFTAEIALGVVFMNDVFMNRFVPTISTLGSGTSFGATPGLNGEWGWINNRDNTTNLLGETGLFFGRYQIFPKPLPHAKDAVVFIYRHCAQAWREVCPIDEHPDTVSGTSAVTVAADAVTADFNGTTNIVSLRLSSVMDAGVGTPVAITKADATAFAAIVADSSLAPIYQFAWAAGVTNEPTAYSDFTAAASSVVKS